MNYKIILLYVIMACSLSIDSEACTCGYVFVTDNLDERITESEEIFIGSVVKIEVVKNNKALRNPADSVLIKVDFLVSKLYKGRKNNTFISVYQRRDNCMISFEINKQYIVFTKEQNSAQYAFTNQCTPTLEVDEANKEYKTVLDEVERKQDIN